MTGTQMEEELSKQLDTQLVDVAKGNREEAAKRVEQVLNDWLSFTRKKQTDNLPGKLEQFRKRISVLARNVTIGYREGELVVNATGDGEITLRMLERGTDWFDPADDPSALIAGAILNKP